jgi:hypothetical protein
VPDNLWIECAIKEPEYKSFYSESCYDGDYWYGKTAARGTSGYSADRPVYDNVSVVTGNTKRDLVEKNKFYLEMADLHSLDSDDAENIAELCKMNKMSIKDAVTHYLEITNYGQWPMPKKANSWDNIFVFE